MAETRWHTIGPRGEDEYVTLEVEGNRPHQWVPVGTYSTLERAKKAFDSMEVIARARIVRVPRQVWTNFK